MESGLASRLPDFTVKKSKDFPEWLLVYCGYEDCPSYATVGGLEGPGYFMAHARSFQKVIAGGATTTKTRPCPYCFRVSFVPALKKGKS